MADEPTIPRWKNDLTTVLFEGIALVVAGGLGAMSPFPGTSPWVASALFVVMLSAYSLWTRPGWRSGSFAYWGGGLALGPIAVAMMMLMLWVERLDLLWLADATTVGWHPGGMDSGLMFGGLLWWISILLLIGVSLAPRAFLDLPPRYGVSR